MPYKMFDRSSLVFKSLLARKNKVFIERDHIPTSQLPKNNSEHFLNTIEEVSTRIKEAKKNNAAVIL
ncbi:MAG: hypothetical protein Q8T08_04080, partial [Ignavibacteria bacterium]|nr:hypothetical protein [Ignavibacteria bacterium]